jgi:hypothetical protein
MKSPIKISLLAALPIEVVVFFLFAFPIDVGLPDNAPWYRSAMALIWFFIHYPAFRLALFGQSVFPVWFLIGYLDTVLLLIAGIHAFRGLRHLTGKLAAT